MTYTPRPAGSCGTRQVPGQFVGTPKWALAPGDQRTIYLNRFGGTYEVKRGAATDSSTNVVSSQTSADGNARTAVIPPLASDFDWPTISACVREHFAPYNVRIVEYEPSSGPYIEAVVGGSGTSLGFPSGALLGIAAADNFCGVTEAGIAFNFSEDHRGIQQRDLELCATIAHEVGHLIALEHEALARDLMSYVPVFQAPNKAFVDQDSACGTSPQDTYRCSCTANTTNSHQRLVSHVGARPVEGVAPTLQLVSPGGDKVPPVFEIVATATDDGGMSDVFALIDGQEVAGSNTPTGNEYRFVIAGVTEGAHTLTVVARDLANNETRIEKAITVAKAVTGESCVANEACVGGLCAELDDARFCTQTCELSADDCPTDFECVEAGAMAVCVPTSSGGGCGCSAQGGQGATALLALGVGMILFGRRRSRRA